MPVSTFWGKQVVVEWIGAHHTNIQRILDIGVGCGTYSDLIRSAGYCHHTEWVGVEVWQPYITQYRLPEKYDAIINQDARYIDWERMGWYHVTFAGDVLEHMTKVEAQELVANILERTEILIMTIPVVYWPQDEHEGNPYERHVKPDWSIQEVFETWSANIRQCWHVPESPVAVFWMKK